MYVFCDESVLSISLDVCSSATVFINSSSLSSPAPRLTSSLFQCPFVLAFCSGLFCPCSAFAHFSIAVLPKVRRKKVIFSDGQKAKSRQKTKCCQGNLGHFRTASAGDTKKLTKCVWFNNPHPFFWEEERNWKTLSQDINQETNPCGNGNRTAEIYLAHQFLHFCLLSVSLALAQKPCYFSHQRDSWQSCKSATGFVTKMRCLSCVFYPVKMSFSHEKRICRMFCLKKILPTTLLGYSRLYGLVAHTSSFCVHFKRVHWHSFRHLDIDSKQFYLRQNCLFCLGLPKYFPFLISCLLSHRRWRDLYPFTAEKRPKGIDLCLLRLFSWKYIMLRPLIFLWGAKRLDKLEKMTMFFFTPHVGTKRVFFQNFSWYVFTFAALRESVFLFGKGLKVSLDLVQTEGASSSKSFVSSLQVSFFLLLDRPSMERLQRPRNKLVLPSQRELMTLKLSKGKCKLSKALLRKCSRSLDSYHVVEIFFRKKDLCWKVFFSGKAAVLAFGGLPRAVRREQSGWWKRGRCKRDLPDRKILHSKTLLLFAIIQKPRPQFNQTLFLCKPRLGNVEFMIRAFNFE